LGATAGRIVLMGDLFNLWLGDPGLEQDHHRQVVDCFRELRAAGSEVHYLEATAINRNRPCTSRRRVQRGGCDGTTRGLGGRTIWAAHGDLVNRHDLQYRSWRFISRMTPTWWLMSAIPRAKRFALAEAMERPCAARTSR
jgi:UDP-2,3-diacylglucosamine pyrophosphatase LpxH